MRWDTYILASADEFDPFWRDHLAGGKRETLFVLGRGFDSRALKALRRICALDALPKVWLLAFDNGQSESQLTSELTVANRQALAELVGPANIVELPVNIGMTSHPNATSRCTRNAISKQGTAATADDVVIDISAMPRVVALSAIAQLIHDQDRDALGGKISNLHVVAAESVRTDLEATGSLMDEVTSIGGFSGRLNEETTEHVPRVWFPVLGERQRERLLLIRSHLNPDEICPVVPFPSRDPRRGDQILAENIDLLFEDFRVEPSNILRASEFNPFEAYRQLFLAMDRYRKALTELGGCKTYVSPLSSKLLSVGALLACYDHQFGVVEGERLNVGMPYVETSVYADPKERDDAQSELYSMWIRGEWER